MLLSLELCILVNPKKLLDILPGHTICHLIPIQSSFKLKWISISMLGVWGCSWDYSWVYNVLKWYVCIWYYPRELEDWPPTTIFLHNHLPAKSHVNHDGWRVHPPYYVLTKKKHMEVSLNRGTPKPFMLFSDFPWDKPSSSWGTVPPFQEPPWWFLQKLCPRLHDPLELRKAHTVVPTGICLKIAGVNDVK